MASFQSGHARAERGVSMAHTNSATSVMKKNCFIVVRLRASILPSLRPEDKADKACNRPQRP
jgi:hypothetical protein